MVMTLALDMGALVGLVLEMEMLFGVEDVASVLDMVVFAVAQTIVMVSVAVDQKVVETLVVVGLGMVA